MLGVLLSEALVGRRLLFDLIASTTHDEIREAPLVRELVSDFVMGCMFTPSRVLSTLVFATIDILLRLSLRAGC